MSKRCSADGCRKWAVPGATPPMCKEHSVDDEAGGAQREQGARRGSGSMADEVPLGPPPPPKSAAGAAAMKQAQVLVGPPPPPKSAAGGARTSGEQAELDKQIYVSANGGNADEVTSLLAAGADPDGHKNAVRACAPVA